MKIDFRAAALAAFGFGTFACTGNATTSVLDGGAPGEQGQPGTPTWPPATSTSTAPPPPPPPQRAQLRLANAAYQTGPVDFCVRKAGASTWEGPLLAKLGVTGGADQGQVTNTFDREVGSWDVGVVTAKATTCDKPFVTTTKAVAIPGDGSALVVLIGNAGVVGTEANSLVTLDDDGAAPAANKARVRFLHASPNWLGGKASVYLDGRASTLAAVGFGQLASYADVVPASEIAVRGLADSSGTRDVYGTFSAKAGSRATMIFEGAAGSSFYPPRVLTCPDDLTLATADAPFLACR